MQVRVVTVFAAGPGGGNPAPIVLDAAQLSDADMQAVAREYGHESAFVLPASAGSGCAFAFRFWVPNHEMPMCGHATVGAVWLLDQLGLIPSDELFIETRSGVVAARLTGSERRVEVSQPLGQVEPVDETLVPAVLDALGISAAELAALPVQNARTSRTKTLAPVTSVEVLDRLTPRFDRIERVCDLLGSTGLYPYAVFDSERQIFDARQFPRSSGYPEDAATGIAAAALAFGLLANDLVESSEGRISVRQGRAMGRPSEIGLRFAVHDGEVQGVWLGGNAEFAGP